MGAKSVRSSVTGGRPPPLQDHPPSHASVAESTFVNQEPPRPSKVDEPPASRGRWGGTNSMPLERRDNHRTKNSSGKPWDYDQNRSQWDSKHADRPARRFESSWQDATRPDRWNGSNFNKPWQQDKSSTNNSWDDRGSHWHRSDRRDAWNRSRSPITRKRRSRSPITRTRAVSPPRRGSDRTDNRRPKPW